MAAGFQLLDVVDATKAGPAGLLDLVFAGVSWDNATYASGVEFANDGKTFLFVSNKTGAKDVIIGWIPVNDPDGRVIPDSTLAPQVDFGKEGLMGPYLPRIWNSSEGRIQFLPDQVAEVLINFVAIRIANPT